ncbi:hypothetical protein U1Q18_020003 [Sarracenia purpurea var. burkii]
MRSSARVYGKGKEVFIEAPKPSYAEAIISEAHRKGLVGAEIHLPVHNPVGVGGNDSETARGSRAIKDFLPELILRAPEGKAGTHPDHSYGENGGLHRGRRDNADMRCNVQQPPIYRKPGTGISSLNLPNRNRVATGVQPRQTMSREEEEIWIQRTV